MLKIIENFDLSKISYFRTGGLAKYAVEIKEEDDWLKLNDFLRKYKVKKMVVVGAGSNILFADGIHNMLVIKNNFSGWRSKNGKWTINAGAMLPLTAMEVSRYGYTGLEHLANIPGTVGGGIRGNVEAYGQVISRYLEKVEWWDMRKGGMILNKNECQFKYRESIFKRKLEGKGLIKSASFNFRRGNKKELLEIIKQDKAKRAASQPWEPSCGCFFKNIYLSKGNWKKIETRFGKEALVNLKFGDYFSTGRLIDLLGLKGKMVGGASVSTKHGNFIINAGKATSNDIFQLFTKIKRRVNKETGLILENEVALEGNFRKKCN